MIDFLLPPDELLRRRADDDNLPAPCPATGKWEDDEGGDGDADDDGDGEHDDDGCD